MFSFRKILYIFLLGLLIFSGYKILAYFGFFSRNLSDIENAEKIIQVTINGSDFVSRSHSQTIANWLEENNIELNEHDEVIPAEQTRLFSGMNLQIRKALKIKIEVDGKNFETFTLQNNIEKALAENGVILSRLDKTQPEKNLPPQENQKIIVTRINIEEKIIPEDIDFPITYKNDAKLSWREEKIQEPGEKGVKEVKYRITYKNGKEISRLTLEKNVTKKPIAQVVVKGTYMQLEKANKGQGTWYAFKGGLFAASTTLPRGSFAKVTNTANGKSVVVQINDYGPQGKGRIIDLDKVAFAKIASLGAGVIGVKVEQILN
jgi:uncharacterized protein YabE (DUF348 family)